MKCLLSSIVYYFTIEPSYLYTDNTFTMVTEYIIDTFNYILPKSVIRLFIVYFVWISMHYAATHMYVKFCTPWSVQGFIMSPILVPAPHCEGLRWMIYYGAVRIHTMWILFGGYLISMAERMMTSKC